MQFVPILRSATLLRRYKRFLADVVLDDGNETTIYCSNTGAMTGCAEPGSVVWYSQSDNPKRKYALSWELTQTSAGHWICVNTAQANRLVTEAIEQSRIPELMGYGHLRREVKYGTENSRIDLLLSDDAKPDCYIEVKSCTLLETNGQGYFPDAVSTRGQKHLRELIQMRHQGYRSVLFFAVLHTGIECVSAASHIDSRYAALLDEAQTAGVEVLAYGAELSEKGMALKHSLPFI